MTTTPSGLTTPEFFKQGTFDFSSEDDRTYIIADSVSDANGSVETFTYPKSKWVVVGHQTSEDETPSFEWIYTPESVKTGIADESMVDAGVPITSTFAQTTFYLGKDEDNQVLVAKEGNLDDIILSLYSTEPLPATELSLRTKFRQQFPELLEATTETDLATENSRIDFWIRLARDNISRAAVDLTLLAAAHLYAVDQASISDEDSSTSTFIGDKEIQSERIGSKSITYFNPSQTSTSPNMSTRDVMRRTIYGQMFLMMEERRLGFSVRVL